MLKKFPFQELHSWYQENGRYNLPWRDYSFDEKQLGYRVWLSETMLQQTQVERVKSYFENILKAFPAVENLAATSYEEFFPYYKGLGYYSRARNMLEAARQVVDNHSGVFPKTTEDLTKLKGVGPYTAEAIKAFAYDIPTLSFDTNLEKIFSRYYFGNKFQKLSKKEKSELLIQMEKFYNSLAHLSPDRGISRDINNALMDFGATTSLNSVANINWEKYPLTCCEFYKTRAELEPIPQKKISHFPNKQAFIIAILHENHKAYFSEIASLSNEEDGGEDFSPFLIGKNTGNPRLQIQNYFHKKYGLELSVRPPEIKSYNKDDIPYLVCYCQIQSGTHNFQVSEGIKVRGFEESLVEKIDFGVNLSLF